MSYPLVDSVGFSCVSTLKSDSVILPESCWVRQVGLESSEVFFMHHGDGTMTKIEKIRKWTFEYYR